jgi:NAD(P)-dependent dehydrogenase (short-subunit alcohol dehydrogenase family)
MAHGYTREIAPHRLLRDRVKIILMNTTKTALITGATSGIGSIVAEHLVNRGYALIVLGRSAEKLSLLSNQLKRLHTNVNLITIVCDLASFNSIKKACDEIRTKSSTIDILVLNAGIWNFKFIETTDAIEETFQVNLLAPFILYKRLNDLIPHTKESKVIFTTSGLHQGKINFSDIEFRAHFSGFKSYRQSKLGLLMLTRWLSEQPEDSGISFYAVHPGMVNTQLGRSAGWFSQLIFRLLGKSKEKGAQTHIHLIDAHSTALKSGAYYANRKVTQTTKYSCDMEQAKRLWDVLNDYDKKKT